MTQILLVGSDAPLLEGLAQSFAAMGHAPRVATSIAEARELAVALPPLVAVVERSMAAQSSGDALRITLAAGGAMVLFRGTGSVSTPLPHSQQRQVLAELALPLERNRLMALVQHVQDRVVATGRGRTEDPEERARP